MSSNPLEQVPILVADLSRVEAELINAIASENELLTDVAGHLIAAGGKRVRPGFAIAAAAAGSQTFEPASHEVILGAVSVELVHQGSLYHDDVMDSADTRRTVESVNSKWGNHKAILAGDFLLGRSSEIAASLGVEVAGLLAATISHLCDGQIRELEFVGRTDRTEASYFASIEGKTASLLSSACRIGGIVGGLSTEHTDNLTAFGTAYGLAFQVVDDILDLTATDEELGKPAGNDILEGVYTLPVIRALQIDADGSLEKLLSGTVTPEQRDEAREIVRSRGGFISAHEEARRLSNEAAVALGSMADTAGGAALLAAAEHLVSRVESLVY